MSLERAHELLKNTKNAATSNRLSECAFRALSMIHAFRPDWTTFSLEQTLHRHEARYIQMALEDAGGKISPAARLLSLSRQILDYILKSRHKNLRNVLTAVGGQEANPDENASGRGSELGTQKVRAFRILHVEDDLTVTGLVREIGEHQGWTVKQLIDGDAALEELASDAEYDVLLVDHDLPGMSGLELIEHVRSMFHRRYMPIVMMSGALEEATAREAGADAFLRKPQDIGLLAETITRLLDEREQEE